MKKINKINTIHDAVLLVPDIRSALNVGSLFRTADAAGVSKLFLTGCTPCPTDIFGRQQKDIAKSALGAEIWIQWEYRKTVVPLIKKLKKEGYTVVALEQDRTAKDYRTSKMPSKVALIVGPEVNGLSQKILHECDEIIEIPMYGKKESLNVSVATGIALFKLLHP